MTIINLLEHPWRLRLFLGESKLAYTHLASDTSQHLDMQMIAYISNKLADKYPPTEHPAIRDQIQDLDPVCTQLQTEKPF